VGNIPASRRLFWQLQPHLRTRCAKTHSLQGLDSGHYSSSLVVLLLFCSSFSRFVFLRSFADPFVVNQEQLDSSWSKKKKKKKMMMMMMMMMGGVQKLSRCSGIGER
jgi:hypothetical protein